MGIITAAGLSFEYPNGKRALSDVSLDISEGSFVTLCGRSGCGKSTLLRLLQPALSPHGTLSGELTFCGEPLHSLPPRRTAEEIGFVMQNPEAAIVTDKVWHELAFSLESTGVPTDVIRRRVGEMAGYFGLEDSFGCDTATLSGGQKQLLCLAAAAALHPKLLLLDEPSSMLDPIAAQGFIDALSRLNRDFGMTVVIAEHRLEELLQASDRVIVLDEGRIIADCVPRKICAELTAEHPMMAAMPVAVRAYALSGGGDCAPLSVREGRADARCIAAVKQLREAEKKAQHGGELLHAKELWVSFERHGRDVLKRADLSVHEGEILAILGGNGSGKTTLLKCLAGIIKPLGGRVKLKKGAACAYLPQNPCAIFTEDSVREELCSASADFEALAEKFGLSGLLSCHPYDLSGGEQQRLAIAKLMLTKPDVLLLDEPTKGMDAAAKKELCRLLRGLSEEGFAAVLVTHDTELAAACADRCGLLFGGEISGIAAPQVFFSENYFYTTPARRLCRGINDGVIRLEQEEFQW